MMAQQITADLEALWGVLPPHIREPLMSMEGRDELLEVVMDLGRVPTARFPGREVVLSEREVTIEDLEYVVDNIGAFGDDNRAGIPRTLHRISAIRSRNGRIIGLTCRVGRAIFGTITAIEDLVRSGASILLLGRPGVGKTTMLREVARVLADEMGKRVIIVDTSNEIAGDGDIPHPAIGKARRMQVPRSALQHAVMIEAVENHMPEVIVIDEIGTELEAAAARTIAERGVQLVATAHGNTLDNLILNPTLSDLVGGIQAVTLGDEEARRRGTQKTVLERKAPPTFDVVVEIQDFHRIAVHTDVASTVDAFLRGQPIAPEVRWRDEAGRVHREPGATLALDRGAPTPAPRPARANRPEQDSVLRLYPFGISRSSLERAAREVGTRLAFTTDLRQADAVVTTRSYYRRKHTNVLRAAEEANIPIYVVKGHSLPHIEQLFLSLFPDRPQVNGTDRAVEEALEAIRVVLQEQHPVRLSPQSAPVRRIQHQLAEQNGLLSRSEGRDPHRAVIILGPKEEIEEQLALRSRRIR